MRRDRVDWVDRLLSRRDNVNLLIEWIVHDLAEVFLNEDAADPLWDFIYGAADAAGAFAEFQAAVETLFRPVLALPAQKWRAAAREAARLLSSELPLAEVFPEAARKVAAGEDVPPEPSKQVLLKMLERLRAAAKAMCEPTYPFTPLPAVKVFDLGGVLVWPDGPEGERPSVPDVFLTLRDELGKRYRLDDEVPRFIVDQPIVEYAIQVNEVLVALLDRLGEAVMWCWNRRWLRWKEAGDICRQEESALEALRRELREARNSDETPTPVAALREPLRQLVEKRLEEIGEERKHLAASAGSEWGEEELVPGVVWPGGELVLSGGRQYRLGDSKDRVLLATQLLGHPDVGWRPEGIVRILKRLARIRERLSFIRYGWTGG